VHDHLLEQFAGPLALAVAVYVQPGEVGGRFDGFGLDIERLLVGLGRLVKSPDGLRTMPRLLRGSAFFGMSLAACWYSQAAR
jgi:hypothetical protein